MIIGVFIIFFSFKIPGALALEPGTILYRTSSQGKMYGYSTKDLITEENGLMTHIYPGHAGIYVGEENGRHYVVEALSTGIVKTPLEYFVNESLGEEFIGAKIPKQASSWQRAKAVAIAKFLAQADLAYDFDFSDQKGPASGDWTCVGLTEKVYESADAYNPERLSALEYDPRYYAVDITPDGFDSQSIYNEKKDVFSKDLEFSKISRRKSTILPVPEIIGYNAGKEFQSNRYIFMPYTQALQNSLRSVPVDLKISSSFDDRVVRGKVNSLGLILRWSLINNPVSSAKKIAGAISSIFKDDNSEALVRLSDTENQYQEISYRDLALEQPLVVVDNPKMTNEVKPEKTAADYQSLTQLASIPESNNSLNTEGKTKTSGKESQIKVTNTTQATASGKLDNNTTKNTSLALWSPVAVPIIKQAEKEQTSHTSKAVKENINQVSDQSNQIKGNNTSDETENEAEVAPLTLVISRIQADSKDDWLEIWNYGDQDINLQERKIRIEKAKTASDPGIILRFDVDTDYINKQSVIIRAGESFKIVRDDASPEIIALAQAIAIRPDFTFTNDGYTLYLAKGPVSSPDDEDIIDYVGYGSALYYEGSGAAPTLETGYILRRKAAVTTQLADILLDGVQANWPPIFDSDDNAHDFLLWPIGGEIISDDLSDEEVEDLKNNDADELTNQEEDDEIVDEEANTSDEDDSNDAFTLQPGLNSQGLFRLWSFSECQGTSSQDMISQKADSVMKSAGFWAVGRWGCGQRLPYEFEGGMSTVLEPFLSGQTFTLLFNYKGLSDYSNIYFYLANTELNLGLSVRLFPDMVEFSGFPNLAGRQGAPVGMHKDTWQQVALVWNTNESYWALYIDGNQIFHEQFTGSSPDFNSLGIGAVSGEIIIDDIALWQRALSPEETAFIAEAKQAFNPQVSLSPPNQLLLKHQFNFNENSGQITHDATGGLNWDISPATLDYNGLSGRAYKAPEINDSIILDIPSFTKNNFSLSFWYRNDNDLSNSSGRLHLAVFGQAEFLAELTIDTSRQRLNTGDWDVILAEGDQILTHDNNWHHLALVYNDYRYLWQLYVDGILKIEDHRLPLIKSNVIDSLGFRSSYFGYRLDNFKIWQGALSPSDVLVEYESEKN